MARKHELALNIAAGLAAVAVVGLPIYVLNQDGQVATLANIALATGAVASLFTVAIPKALNKRFSFRAFVATFTFVSALAALFLVGTRYWPVYAVGFSLAGVLHVTARVMGYLRREARLKPAFDRTTRPGRLRALVQPTSEPDICTEGK